MDYFRLLREMRDLAKIVNGATQFPSDVRLPQKSLGWGMCRRDFVKVCGWQCRDVGGRRPLVEDAARAPRSHERG
jgi:hypothetical protein